MSKEAASHRHYVVYRINAQNYGFGRRYPVNDRFLSFINEQRLFAPDQTVLLAVSGGIDSVVMAELFRQAGLRYAIAHVNYGLRGPDSDADEAFVRALAQQHNVVAHTTRVDAYAHAHEQGLSVQVAARVLRYAWFGTLLQTHHYVAVATAHHQNDVLETLLLNLTRGTGLTGLRGIPIQRTDPAAGRIVRPLWFSTRAEIDAFARANNVVWREDRSNASDDYARNRLRHYVVPVLTELNPGLLTQLPHTVERLRAADALLRAELAQSWRQVVNEQFVGTLRLELTRLRALPEPVYRLEEWLRPFGLAERAGAIWAAVGRGVGQEFRSATHRLWHERDHLLLAPLAPDEPYELRIGPPAGNVVEPADTAYVVTTPHFELRIRLFDRPVDFVPPARPAVACLDADRLAWPLTVRPWQPGDRFRPLGLGGSKLISDVLNDLKVSRLERARAAVLLSGSDVAWLIGRRIDHRFRLTSATRRVLRIDVVEATETNGVGART